MLAERDTTDRYLAAYLSEKMGSEFQGKISGIAKFGIFVRLDETGADGIIPIRSLGREYFDYDQTTNTLMGSETGITFSLGLRVTVRLTKQSQRRVALHSNSYQLTTKYISAQADGGVAVTDPSACWSSPNEKLQNRN